MRSWCRVGLGSVDVVFLLLLLLGRCLNYVDSFCCRPTGRSRILGTATTSSLLQDGRNNIDEPENEEENNIKGAKDDLPTATTTTNDSIDDFLDKPFFDPNQVTEDDPLPVRWFSELVKNDYATAEALYSGVLFVMLVVLAQELLRMQINGVDYVPFHSAASSSSTLF